MPCDNSYLEPNNAESDSQRTCQSLVYALTGLNKTIPNWVREAANSIYGNIKRLNESVVLLCKICDSMTEEDVDQIIYDGRNPQARQLADWYDEHKKADKERIKREKKEEKISKTRKAALRKLSPEERESLGI